MGTSVFKLIMEDLRLRSKGSLLNVFIIIIFNRSFNLVLNYRIGSFLSGRSDWVSKITVLYLRYRQLKYHACDISYHSKIGRKILFPHPIGIVIGNNVRIEDNVKIWQHVTIGSKGSVVKEYPVIEPNVRIYSSAQIIGGVLVGKNSIVSASALVRENVEQNSIVAGVPAKFIKKVE